MFSSHYILVYIYVSNSETSSFKIFTSRIKYLKLLNANLSNYYICFERKRVCFPFIFSSGNMQLFLFCDFIAGVQEGGSVSFYCSLYYLCVPLSKLSFSGFCYSPRVSDHHMYQSKPKAPYSWSFRSTIHVW